jgi:polyhydroxybutyrate depolymerase
MRRRTRRLLGVATIVALALASGCVDSDGGTDASTGTPITTTTAVWAPATTVAETSPPVPTTWAPDSDPSSGCASDQRRAEADSTTTVEVDGVERSSRYLAPTRPSPGRPDPVIMLLHGKGSDGATVLDYSQMSSAADQLGAGIVLPEAIGGDHRWTELDVPFLRTVLDQLGAERCIDRNRIWLAGLSMGGFTSARLACDLPGRFAAVAAVAGFGFDGATCPSAPPTPVLTFHGTGDDVIPFAGRPPGFVTVIPSRGAEADIADWAAHNGCAPTPTETAVAPEITIRRWSGCTAETALVVVAGGGHSWPGAYPYPQQGYTTNQISATNEMAGFFARNVQTGAGG